jgi:cytochrome c oxidase assembly protein subunit 15
MFILAKKNYDKVFLYWLISIIILMVVMIIIGGLTRLTDSGLSITKWELFKGVFWPKNLEEWKYHFALYKEIPQFKLLNPNMTLDEFKYIYFWEWFHRILGRAIGLVFLIPFIYFFYKKVFTREYNLKFFLIFILIFFQGALGWYMVKSGLVNDITVSHYRLSSHLLIAFVILSSLIWILLNYFSSLNKKFFNNYTEAISIKILIFFIFFQIIFGAFVSGLDAGKIYQTWPLMNDSFFPNDVIIKNFFDLFNFQEKSLVQFFHRNIAYFIFFLVLFIGYEINKKKLKNLLKPYLYVLIFLLFQIVLGIFTLISGLNIHVASLHQISSIFLTILSLNLYHHAIN